MFLEKPETAPDLLQSQNLNGTEVAETFCNLLQREPGQDERRTCTGETQTGQMHLSSEDRRTQVLRCSGAQVLRYL